MATYATTAKKDAPWGGRQVTREVRVAERVAGSDTCFIQIVAEVTYRPARHNPRKAWPGSRTTVRVMKCERCHWVGGIWTDTPFEALSWELQETLRNYAIANATSGALLTNF